LVDDVAPPPASSTAHRGNTPRQARKPALTLTPAKKLLKITGGRALANADELRAFNNALSVESIDELIEGLADADWKVRAILGLELAGERYGLQAVAKAKQVCSV
jgi:hypothetical protein